MRWHVPDRSPRRFTVALAVPALLALAQVAGQAGEPAPPDPAVPRKACPPPGTPPDPAATTDCVPVVPTPPSIPSVAGGGGGPGGGSGGGSGPGANNGPGTGNDTTQPDQPQQPADRLPEGPYVVRQTSTFGSERISGSSCRLGDPFVVDFVTRRVAFSALFTPRGGPMAGSVGYAYSVPGAGETHAAQGTYTGQMDVAAHVVHITMSVSDHVVFKGFDGNIPLDYGFDLVPSPGIPCVPPRQ